MEQQTLPGIPPESPPPRPTVDHVVINLHDRWGAELRIALSVQQIADLHDLLADFDGAWS